MQIKSFFYKIDLVGGDTMRLFQIPFLHGSRKLNMHIERILQIRTSVYQEISAKPVKYIFKGGDEIYIFCEPGDRKMKSQVQRMILVIEIRIVRIDFLIGQFRDFVQFRVGSKSYCVFHGPAFQNGAVLAELLQLGERKLADEIALSWNLIEDSFLAQGI